MIRTFLRAFLAEARRIREAADLGTPPRVAWIERARDVDGYLVAELHQPATEPRPLDRARAVEILRSENPRARADDLTVYADAFLTYQEAAENIARNGTVCAHPRTGAPIENPFVKARASATKVMQSVKRIRNVDALWKAAG